MYRRHKYSIGIYTNSAGPALKGCNVATEKSTMELTCNKSGDSLDKKRDFIHLAILLAIALGIGLYLTVTTPVITKDGVLYIQQAMKFSSDPQAVIKKLPPGYPFLIFATHKLAVSLGGGSSLFVWIYSAQGITLLCRLLSLIPLYFIGKILVGGKRSFQAVFVLIILPYPAEFVSDILREWPNILFLASGFLFLLIAARRGIWWLFPAAGLAAGLGHIIRPECAQIIVYGALWIFIRLIYPKPGLSRAKLLCALALLIIGFAIPAAPYMTARGKLLPEKLKKLISSAEPKEPKELCEPEINSGKKIYTASGVPGRIAQAFDELAIGICDDLFYFFVPAWLIGIYFYFRKKSPVTEIDTFFVPAFAVFNIVMLIALFYSWGYISRRHCLPLVVFTIFYVPIGLEVLAGWLADRFSPARDGLRHKSRPASGKDRRTWFLILLIIGTIICLPKLLSRPGTDKPGYRAAAAWLKENTTKDDLIASPDNRITFYAERKALIYETAPAGKTAYIVIVVKDENKVPDFVKNAQKEYSVWENEHKKTKKIVIYKTPP
jgi:hypothetical protein